MSAKLSAPRIVISPTVSSTRPAGPLARPAQIRARGNPTVEDKITILSPSSQLLARVLPHLAC